MSSALDVVASWPVTTAAVAVVDATGVVESTGPSELALPWASVTKVLTALATWIAIEEGTVALDEPAGPPASTLRHLLAHASGLAFDEDAAIGAPGVRRVYSNRGFEVLADVVAARAGMPFERYVEDGVLAPLGMTATTVHGSPAAAGVGPLVDLAALGRELLAPILVSDETLALVTTTAFPGLRGVVPGFGRHDPNDWGLGVEIRDGKSPHWTPTTASPRTFGHFGRSGTFLWVDPDAGVACACLTDREFGDWAIEAWPALGDAVLADRSPRGG